MIGEEFQIAMEWLMEVDLGTPHKLIPGSYPGGNQTFLTKEEWESYRWQLLDEEDLTAHPKVTWETIVSAVEPAMGTLLLPRRLSDLRHECRRRITMREGRGFPPSGSLAPRLDFILDKPWAIS